MAHFLVTGGAGFIGSHLVTALLKDGHRVKVIDNLSTGSLSNLELIIDQIDFIEGDICSTSDITRAVADMDYILHQAAIPSVPRSVSDPVTSNHNNIDGTLKVLVAARDAAVKRVVCASSSSVYGADPSIPKIETQPTHPKSPYALTKLTGEMYCRLFFELYGLETVSLRYFNIFGPRQNPHNQYAAVIPLFIEKLMKGETPGIHSDGDQSRDFTFVDNAVQANIRACYADNAPGKVFNIGSGNCITVNQLYSKLSDLLDTAIKPEYSAAREGDVRHSLADISRARKILEYDPLIDVYEGLRRTVSYFRGNH